MLCCVGACAVVVSAQDRLEFSGLQSPCDEAAEDQAETIAALGDTNDDIADQLVALQARVEDELLTYGDSTNVCGARYVKFTSLFV